MIYKVKSYDVAKMAHLCETDTGLRAVDLMVSGCFPKETKPEDLIGKTFESRSEFPWISLAIGVKEIIL